MFDVVKVLYHSKSIMFVGLEKYSIVSFAMWLVIAKIIDFFFSFFLHISIIFCIFALQK